MANSTRWILLGVTIALLSIGCVILNDPKRASPTPELAQSSSELANYRQAAAYSEARGGLSMLVSRQGKVIFEAYAPGVKPEQPHLLASGTKSFSCAIAVAAANDGLLRLDEPVANTIQEWQSDSRRSKITIRQLLNLTSGLPGGTIGQVPTYSQAISTLATASPDSRFQYGPIPFQVFGELMRRKLLRAGLAADPLDYLQRKVLVPIGLQVGNWRRSVDGLPHLPSGASLTAREWAKFGTLIASEGQWNQKLILDPQLLSQCFQGSSANPAYGLTFWLNANGVTPSGRPLHKPQDSPSDLWMALGAGNQGLFILPGQKLVIVRQGKINRRTSTMRNSFDNQQFLRLALGK